MRVSTFHIVIFFSLLVSLSGCQNENALNLSQHEVKQLRLIVPDDGYFQITRKDWEENGLVIHDSDQIQLQYQGEPHPYWISSEPDSYDFSIRFYSPPISPDLNLSENVFILSEATLESDRQIIPKTAASAQNKFLKNSFGFYREKYEQQSLYLPQVAGEDHWLWALFQLPEPITLEIQLPQVPVDGSSVQVHVWISPTTGENSGQQFAASINSHDLDPIQVHEQGWQIIEFPLDPSYLKRNNIFSIQPVISSDYLPRKIYLDWIVTKYSLPVNLGDQLQAFAIRDNQLLTSASSSSGTLLILDKNQQLLDIYSSLPNDQFMLAHQPDTTYAWIPEDQFLPVTNIQPIHDENLTLPSQPIDYLVIAPKNFHQALSPLIELRQRQGLSIWIVSPQQIYDSYNSATPSVDAIKEFVQSIYENDPGRLKYLLLVGDYSYEYVDYQKSIEYVPSFFITSGQSGQIISDFPFADLTGDLQPDLSVGRIPAQTPEQVVTWVEKVILYESSIPSEWNQITAISDPSDKKFNEFAQQFLNPFADEYRTQLFNDPNVYEIQEIFKSSFSLVAYFGHGSIDLWGEKRILSIPMLSELPKSSAPPVLISFSCLNGYFIHPQKISLAEGLLFFPEGGVTAIYAPAGQTLMEDQEKLLQFFQNKLQSKDHSRIGNLLFPQEGEKFSENYSVTDIQKTYIYFGDPAMIIP